MFRKLGDFVVMREQDAGGAAAGSAVPPLVAAAAAGVTPPTATPPAATPPAATPPDAAAPYYPEGIPETLRGKTDRETLDNIAKDLAARPKPPEKSDGYELKLDDDLQKRFGDLKDDKVLPMWREVAHELGLSPDQFNGAFGKLYSRMAEAGLIDEPVNVAAELAKLAPAAGDALQKQSAAIERVNAQATWINGLVARNALTATEAAKLTDVLATSDGVIALEKIGKLVGGTGLQGGGAPGGGSQQQDPLKLMFPTHYAT